jgi:hypothetical protein
MQSLKAKKLVYCILAVFNVSIADADELQSQTIIQTLTKKVIDRVPLEWSYLNIPSRITTSMEEQFTFEDHPTLKDNLIKALKAKLIECPDDLEFTSLIKDWVSNNNNLRNTYYCFSEKGRYSGTDLAGSRIIEQRSETVQDCQRQCHENGQCRYFLYFSDQHYQRFKHRTCRLLRNKVTRF